jgi:hypothetical protein
MIVVHDIEMKISYYYGELKVMVILNIPKGKRQFAAIRVLVI